MDYISDHYGCWFEETVNRTSNLDSEGCDYCYFLWSVFANHKGNLNRQNGYMSGTSL